MDGLFSLFGKISAGMFYCSRVKVTFMGPNIGDEVILSLRTLNYQPGKVFAGRGDYVYR